MRTEVYAGRVAYCPLVSHVDYVPHALKKIRQTDGSQAETVRFPLDAASVTVSDI